MPASKVAVWKGSRQLRQRPDSPVLDHNESGERWTFTFEGPYEVCKKARPKRGASYQGYPGLGIDTVKLEKLAPNRGKLTFTLCSAPVPDQDTAFEAGADITWEVEWIEVQLPLEANARYRAGGAAEIDSSGWDTIDLWRNSDGTKKKELYDALSDGPVKEFLSKIKRGNDSFVVYVPVCRKTIKTKQRQTATICGRRENPPAEVRVDGYTYLKTADRISKTARAWTRVIEWTGAYYVDTDLYPAAS